MSNDFKKVLLKDDRLMVTDSVNYAVLKGGQNVVCSTQPAISQSTSALTFNIQVPSEQTVVDRRILWAMTTTLTFTCANTIVYGTDVCLAPFPNHQLCSTLQATINNNSTSINISDVLPALLKLEEGRELQRFSGTCPTASDVYYNYTDCQGQPNNATGSFNVLTSELVNPRGAFYGYNVTTPGTAVNSGVSMTQAGTTYTITYSTCEPLICPPFLWGAPISNTAGMYGVQNMNLVCNFKNGNRAIRFLTASAQTGFSGTVTISTIANSRLLLNYLTPHPSDLMPARNVVPYMEYPRYFSAPGTAIASGAVQTLVSNTYNLNQIPDKLVIFARIPSSTTLTPSNADTFLTIQSISINFNNNAGILSSASMADLYRYSVEAGSNQSWHEFCGQVIDGAALANSTQTINVAGQFIPTVGSVLVLDFARHIQLIEDYYAPGSLGNFQVQFSVNVFNQSSASITPDLVLITVNSGVFVTERGQSSVYTGILTKQDVLDASQQEPYSQMMIKRKVGGSHLDGGKALPKRILPGACRGMEAEKGLSSRLM
jgi:hypothetical protein